MQQNIDPAAGKHAELVENLLQMPAPETREEASATVAGAVKAHVVQKKRKELPKPKEMDLEAFAKKVVKQFQDRYRGDATIGVGPERYVIQDKSGRIAFAVKAHGADRGVFTGLRVPKRSAARTRFLDQGLHGKKQ